MSGFTLYRRGFLHDSQPAQRNSKRRRNRNATKSAWARPCLPSLERLEHRLVLSTVTVTNTSNDAGVSGSLPWAVAQANQATDLTKIVFASDSGQTFATAQTITLSKSLDLKNTTSGASIEIDGPSAGVTIAGGGNGSNYPVFLVETGTTATLDGLTITNGSNPNGISGGGGLLDLGTVYLNNDTFDNNSAMNGGGAISVIGNPAGSNTGNFSAAAQVKNSTFTGNSSGTNGGAVYVNDDAAAFIIGSKFSGNSASSGDGGALFNDFSGYIGITGSTFTNNSAANGAGGAIGDASENGMYVINSTFTDNKAQGSDGGAINNATGPLLVTGSTFAGNSAARNGGGLNGGAWAVFDSTFNANSAVDGGGIYGAGDVYDSTIDGNSTVTNGAGGGVYNAGPALSQTLRLNSTIVSDNTSTTDPDIDGNNATFSASHVLIGNASGLEGTGVSGGQNGNVVGQSASLKPLASNGGPTQTMAPLPGSPALNAGGPFGTLDTAIDNAATKFAIPTNLIPAFVEIANAIQDGSLVFDIQIGSEQMQIDDISGTNFTVTRGVNGTTAAAHNANDPVFIALDQRGLSHVVNGASDIGAYQTQQAAVLPTSTVAALPATEASTSFTVSWSGSDAGGPGIASYSVYVSDNGGPFTAFQTATTATSATFAGVDGHTYGFYSVATDTAGHAQPTP
ncbi:MAG TPA: choice-of-anchor Q domain-containing protein, partial [Pirellulales bacterium]|nr:choice-of-anchor Q domain-containing protein [Pirellulales bacterium]